MKCPPRKYLGILLLCLLTAACSDNRFRELDSLLMQKEQIEARMGRKTDSLRLAFESAPDDITRWEYAEDLYEEWRHLNLDSCARYTREMLRFAGSDQSRILRSKAALVRTLVREESLEEADSVFKSLILPQNASPEDCQAYFYCADRLTNYLHPGDRTALAPLIRALADDYLGRDSTAMKARLLRIKALRYAGYTSEAINYAMSIPLEDFTDIYDLYKQLASLRVQADLHP